MPLPVTARLRNGASVVVRAARPDDAEAWVANFDRVAGEKIYLMTEKFPRTPDEIRTQFRDNDPRFNLWLVAEVGGQVVAGANFARGKWSKNAHTAELGMAVLPEHRGSGIGRMLMESGLEWARSLGVRKVKLGVFASNERAIALYRKMGFAEEGRLKGEVLLDGRPDDEVLMALWM